ncbi:unnamed protein product [Urochloa humidicola]
MTKTETTPVLRYGYFNVPEPSTSLTALGGLKTVKGGCGPHVSMIRLLRHIHISFTTHKETQFPPARCESSSEPNKNDQLETPSHMATGIDMIQARCGQVWQTCRPGLVELSRIKESCGVKLDKLRRSERTAFFSQFPAIGFV